MPNVVYKKNIKQFSQWLLELEYLGYKCFWKILNSKDFGVPQNRERCFMVSIRGDYFYEFSQGKPLQTKLSDLLEPEVDEKYFLSDTAIVSSVNMQFKTSQMNNRLPHNGIVPTICARDYKEPKCVQLDCSGGGQLYSEDYGWLKNLLHNKNN